MLIGDSLLHIKVFELVICEFCEWQEIHSYDFAGD